MDMTAPSWLNQDFVQDVLRRSEADSSIKVVDLYSNMATNKGDNYSSDIMRVYVDFTRTHGDHEITEKKSLILKLAPVDGVRKELIVDFGVFDKEIDMLTQTLPKLNEIAGPKHRLGPVALYVKREVPAFLIIEDLAPLGFRMGNRESGLDLEHSILAIKNIARFHACSVLLCAKEPVHKALYDKGMFHEDHPQEFTQFFSTGINALADSVDTWPELGKTYGDKIRLISKNVYQMGLEAIKRNDDEFNVLNHGDCWVNNMLFRYDDDGKPVEHIFVDFQITSYTSPAIDLHYFLNTSPCPKVYNEDRPFLLDQYLSTLTSMLKELGYEGKIPTMAELKEQLKRRAGYALITAFTVLPIVLAEKDKVRPFEEMVAPDYDNPAYKNELYRKVITKRILYFEELGLLDRFQ